MIKLHNCTYLIIVQLKTHRNHQKIIFQLKAQEYITELNFISEKKTNNQTHTGQKFISANCDRGNDTMQLNFISNNQQ